MREGSREAKTRMTGWCDMLQSCRKLQDPLPAFVGLQMRHLEGIPSLGETQTGGGGRGLAFICRAQSRLLSVALGSGG